MTKILNKRSVILIITIVVFLVLVISRTDETQASTDLQSFSASNYTGDPFISFNDQGPNFSVKEMTNTRSYEVYGELDELGRCTVVTACIGQDLMPTEPRGNIGSVKPTGWHSTKYDIVDGKYLYNRCHLIGYQLTGENANKNNLITGTRYLNVESMLPFENMVADYIKETNNHVIYRVEPIYKGNDLVAQGVIMEAYSIEDRGDGISFSVFCYNVQPGIEIDYATGESWLSGEEAESIPDSSDDDYNIPAIVTVIIIGLVITLLNPKLRNKDRS